MSTWAFLAAPFLALRRSQPPAPPAPAPMPVAVAPASRDTAPAPHEAQPRAIKRRSVSTLQVCTRFVAWMREQGCYGYWLVSEIDEYMAAFCDQQGYSVPHPYDARSRLAEIPGVARGRWSIKTGDEFYDVRVRTDMVRPTLYRISREAPAQMTWNDHVTMVSDGVMTPSRHRHDTIQQGVTQGVTRGKKRRSPKGMQGVTQGVTGVSA